MLTMFESAQVTAPMTLDEARAITDRIKDTVEGLWSLLLEAHERGAWRALGYTTWGAYVEGEFSMSRRRSYQLIDQGVVIRELAAASGSGVNPGYTTVGAGITERDARDLKRELPAVTAEIRERVEAGEKPEAAVRAVVEEKREDRRAERREKEAPKPAPVPDASDIPAPYEEGDEFTGMEDFDPVADLEEANKEIARLEDLVATLQADDTARELVQLSTRYRQLEGALQQARSTGYEAQRQAKYSGDLLAKIRKALGVEKNSQILPSIEALQP